MSKHSLQNSPIRSGRPCAGTGQRRRSQRAGTTWTRSSPRSKTGILVIDATTHTILDINPAAADLIGTPRDRIIGKTCHRFICPAEAGKCPISDLGQDVDNSERILITDGGIKVPIIKYVTPVELFGRACLLETFIDNTERKRAEDELRTAYTELKQNQEEIQAAYAEIAANEQVLLNDYGKLVQSEQRLRESGEQLSDPVRVSQRCHFPVCGWDFYPVQQKNAGGFRVH